MVLRFLFFTLALSFTTLAEGSPQFTATLKRKCEGLLFSTSLQVLLWAPTTAAKKIEKFERINNQHAVRTLTDKERDAVRLKVVSAAFHQWNDLYLSRLQELGLLSSRSVDEDGQIYFIIERDALIARHPQLHSLLPNDYRLVFSPFRLISAGWAAWVNNHDKDIGLPTSILDEQLDVEGLHSILHENVHLFLGRSRTRDGTHRFSSYYRPSGALKTQLEPFLSFYSHRYKSEETIANVVTAAHHLDLICLGEENSLHMRHLILDLDRAFNTATGFREILLPNLEKMQLEKIHIKAGEGREVGTVSLLEPNSELVITLLQEGGSPHDLFKRVLAEARHEDVVFRNLLTVLEKNIPHTVGTDGYVLVEIDAATNFNTLCSARDELWQWVGSVDSSLLKLRSRP